MMLNLILQDGNGQLQIADDVSNLSHFMIGIVYDFSILFYKLYEGFDFLHNHRSKIASLGAIRGYTPNLSPLAGFYQCLDIM